MFGRRLVQVSSLPRGKGGRDRFNPILEPGGYLEHNSQKMRPDIELENLKTEKLKPKTTPTQACVIMVGSTNTGKSTTVNIMTKSKHCTVGEASNDKPCTQKLQRVEDKDTELIYIDNPGQQLSDVLSKFTFFLYLVFVYQVGMTPRSQIEQHLEPF